MSDTCTLHPDAIINIVYNFTGSVFLKYDKFPPSEDALEKFSKARQDAKDRGASEKTLDDLESYLKKVHLEIVELDNDRLATLMEPLIQAIMKFYGEKAVAAGYTTIEISDKTN